AIFSIVNGVLLRPLPYPDAERLAMVYESRTTSGGFSTAAYPNFLDWQKNTRSFTHMAAYCVLNGSLDANGEVESVRGLFGSADLLSVLGIAPVVGRAFSSDEDMPNGAPVVLIGYGLWQQRYAGSSQAIGKRLQIDADTYTIVGVLPESFRLRR